MNTRFFKKALQTKSNFHPQLLVAKAGIDHHDHHSLRMEEQSVNFD